MPRDNWDHAIQMRAQDAGGNRFYGGIGVPGRTMSNPQAGVGSATDMLVNATVNTYGDIQRDRVLLETLYAKFWASARLVDLKPDDAFAGGIVWNDDDQDVVDGMKKEVKRLGLMRKALAAVKAARIYGTAIVILAPKDGNFMREIPMDEYGNLMPEKGEISHLLITDRFFIEDYEVEGNPGNPMFGQIVTYRWNFQLPEGRLIIDNAELMNQIDIHHSRVIRFDGVPPPTSDGWSVTGDDRWGQSILVRAAEDIMQDKILTAAMSELVKRACVPILRIPNLKQMVGRGKQAKKGEMTPEDYADYIGERMTISNIMMIDHEDEVAKMELHTAGIMDAVKKQADRLAMIEGIPITRFTGESASGLSATGEGDARDWRIEVEAYRNKSVDCQIEMLLHCAARNIGLEETPEWEWGRLGEASAEDTALVAKTYAETVVALLTANIIDESEARRMMNESELFDLEEDWTPPPLEVQIAPTMPEGMKGDPKRPKRPMGNPKPTTPPMRK